MMDYKKNFAIICEDLRRILTFNHIYNELWKIIENNEILQKDNLFYWWLGQIYFDAITIGIRRFIGKRKDSISLIRFLEEIKKDRAYNLKEINVQGDIKNIEDITKKIKDVTNERIAHRGLQEIENIPNYEEVQYAISCLEGVVKKYFEIFNDASYHIIFNDAWKNIFRHPWIAKKREAG